MAERADMRGKICMITGATSGIGLVTARVLAGLGASVAIVGRDPAKCEAVADRIRADAGNPDVVYLLADLSSQARIRRVVREFNERFPRLDVLVNNAGTFNFDRRLSPDGFELVFAVNYLAPFLLTNLLLDRLIAGAPSRIVNLTSFIHRRARIDFSDLQPHGLRSYPRSKPAMVLFTYELARRLEGTGVTANVVNPGLVRTAFGTEMPPYARSVQRLMNRVAGVEPEEGAKTVIYLATSPEVEGITGAHFEKGRMTASSPRSYDREIARRLWEVGAILTGLAEGPDATADV